MNEGWEEIYASHYRRLVTLMTALCGSVTDAEEAVQEAFARGLGMSGRRPPPDDPQAWLYRVASNVVKARWRRMKLAQRIWPRLATGEPVGSPADGSDDRLALVNAMRRLPMEQREALALHYFADMAVAAIADRIEVPVGTVKARLSRGRDSLADLLAADSWPPADIDHATADLRQPSFTVIEARRARRTARRAAGAAALGVIVLIGVVWGSSRLPQPPPITPTPTAQPSQSAPVSPEPSLGPTVTPVPPVGSSTTAESVGLSPSGLVFVLERECVTACGPTRAPDGTDQFVILRSNDFGLTWFRAAQVPATMGLEGRLAISDHRILWIVAVDALWGSRNGGGTWERWTIPDAGAFAVRDGTLWLGTETGLMVASDGGAPVRVTRGLPATGFSIDQIVARTGDAAMARLSLESGETRWYQSIDKGRSWREMPGPCAGTSLPDESFSTIGAAPGGQVLWAICAGEPANGQPKAMTISLDGGRTWKARGELEFAGHGYHVQPVNAQVAWRAGYDYTILRTEDARTWTAVTPSTLDSARGFVAIDADTAVLIDYLNVYSTKDGGQTWTAHPMRR